MSKNVAVFVDVANIFYAAKAAGVDIDYVTLLKSASAGRDLVRAYAYTGLDPENENQRNFHSFLARHGYRVVSKDIRKYGDGKVKANLDIELVVDMMKTARNLDIAIVVSGDGDFAPAIRAVQEMGVRVEVISFRGNTSSDLMDVADQFTDITALAKVERGSSRSGRRVAQADDEDLSMTEVPDKQTEGTGAGRSRGGRGRDRGRTRDAEPVERTRSGRGGTRREVAAVTSSGAPLTVLPGEKLSRIAVPEPASVAALVGDEDAVGLEEVDGEGALAAFRPGGDGGDSDAEGERRRRRRRGGRGRGRGRGRGEAGEAGEVADGQPVLGGADDAEEAEEATFAAAPRGPRTTPFGSVWDSQLGVPSSPTSRPAPTSLPDDEDFDEPEIPEYLIAEQRRNRGTGGRGQGGRGGRGARGGYAAAVERERYGRGGGGGGGINRYPDVSGRERQAREAGYGRSDRNDRPPRQDRPERQERQGQRAGSEWSEVPPEIEEMLRAQLATRPKGAPAPQPAQPSAAPMPSEDDLETRAATAEVMTETEAEPAAPRRRTTRRTKAAEADATSATPATATDDAAVAADAAPKRRTTRRTKAASDDATDAAATAAPAEAEAAPKRRTTRRTKAAATETAQPEGAADAAAVDAAAAEAAAPKRRATRRKTATEPTDG